MSDRAEILEAIMPGLLSVSIDPDDDAVGRGAIVCVRAGVVAGVTVVKELFGRLGVRLRPIVGDGMQIADEQIGSDWTAKQLADLDRIAAGERQEEP